MEYEVLREARLRVPFRPFTLTTKDGSVYHVIDETTMAIGPRDLMVQDNEGRAVRLGLKEVVALSYLDETSGKLT